MRHCTANFEDKKKQSWDGQSLAFVNDDKLFSLPSGNRILLIWSRAAIDNNSHPVITSKTPICASAQSQNDPSLSSLRTSQQTFTQPTPSAGGIKTAFERSHRPTDSACYIPYQYDLLRVNVIMTLEQRVRCKPSSLMWSECISSSWMTNGYWLMRRSSILRYNERQIKDSQGSWCLQGITPISKKKI